LQVSSEITGELPATYLSGLGDILFKMLPAGSVSGAPKQLTLAIIRQAEQEPRGYYTGVFGYFDGKELDSAVMIRFIEENNGKKYFRSGGGITVFSDPQKEYNEVIDKI
jgi:para-aminobenzoate synthetase component 1